MLINFNQLKTFYNALLQKTKEFRGNWNQNDASANDFIKNRPFYSEFSSNATAPEGVYIYTDWSPIIENFPSLIEGETYTVIWDNVKYSCTARNDGYGDIYLGNQMLVGGEDFPEIIISNEPFFLGVYGDEEAEICALPGEHTLSIFLNEQSILEEIAIYIECDTSYAWYMEDRNGSKPWLIAGQSYNVIWNGVQYNCLARDMGYGAVYLGNQSIPKREGWGDFIEPISSNEPFFIISAEIYYTLLFL